jgi:hypothetical protein
VSQGRTRNMPSHRPGFSRVNGFKKGGKRGFCFVVC